MKKLVSLSLSLMMLLGMLAVPAMADDFLVGTLSYLNMTEEDNYRIGLAMKQPLKKLLFMHDVWTDDGATAVIGDPAYHYYDTLNAMLMGLQAGEVNCIEVPYYTGKYLCSTNDGLIIREEYHPEKAAGASEVAINMISDGYSFLMKEENVELRDAFDVQIAAMKADGTLQRLIDEHIVRASEGAEPAAIAFEKFEGDPVRIAVTGSLPPMDYVAADGSFAGFNTAVLAEIGRRLQKNIELVQEDSMGRALALSEGTVDVVFWTRGMTDFLLEDEKLSDEEKKEARAEYLEQMTEEERALLKEAGQAARTEMKQQMVSRDMPAGTINTQPYFSDCPVWIILR